MKDAEFKDAILNQKVAFKNGICIICILQITRKLDELGNEYYSDHSVLTVLSYYDQDILIETRQGKNIKEINAWKDDQIKLLF